MKNKEFINPTQKPIIRSPKVVITNSMTPVPAPQPKPSHQPDVIVHREKK